MRNRDIYDLSDDSDKEDSYQDGDMDNDMDRSMDSSLDSDIDMDDELVDMDDDDDVTSTSNIPLPTYDGNNRLDYVEVMKDYNSGDKKLKDKATEKVIGDLTGLVLYIIKKKYATYSVKYYDDLVQAGEIGILIGLKSYDPNLGLPATHFYYFIVHEIQSFINDNVYKTTPYYSSNIKKINKAIAQFEKLNMPYTKRDISIQTGIPLDTIEKVMNIMVGGSEVSLTSFGEQVEGPNNANPELEFIKKSNTEHLYKVMREVLTHEEILVISYMFGLGELDVVSLKNIAKKMHIPIDRVKKLKTTALCKLRNSELAGSHQFSYRHDELVLEEADSISLFPKEQAIATMNDLEDMDIEV